MRWWCAHWCSRSTPSWWIPCWPWHVMSMPWRCTTCRTSRPRQPVGQTAKTWAKRDVHAGPRAAGRGTTAIRNNPQAHEGPSVGFCSSSALHLRGTGDAPMANLNKVLLIGRLTRDPEIVNFSTGGKVAKIGFAVNNRKKNQQTGQWEDVPVFLDVEAYNRDPGRH